MFPFRTTLLAFILGSAALMGWLCYPSGRSVDRVAGDRSVDGAVIHPAHSHGRHSVPGRQRTNPDPTPDDWDDEYACVVDLDNLGPDWAALATLNGMVACGLFDSPTPAWTEPPRHAPLLQLTHRFRC
jgi:hypothetical protein